MINQNVYILTQSHVWFDAWNIYVDAIKGERSMMNQEYIYFINNNNNK